MLGQHGRLGTGGVAGVSVLLAGVLATAVGVAALRTDTASAETVLARGADALVELPDGTSRPAVEGERVPRGATVRAGRTGAELHTREREVHLGADTGVTVVDGVRQVLRAGFVLVDASDAPGLELRTDAGTVTSADDSLVRVDGGPLVRVGVLRGDAADVRAADRQLTTSIDTYFQVQVPRGGLPGPTTPFVLSPGDDYEEELAGDLVAADTALNALASRLDAEGRVGQVVLSSLREQVAPAAATPAGAPGSEQALGFLIATAAEDGAALAARYERVRGLRADGGSWGIVAAIVDAEVGRVGAALNSLLDPGTVPMVAGGTLDVGAALGLGPVVPGAPSSDGPAPGPGSPDSPSDDGQSPDGDGDGDGDGGGPSPTPSPSPGPAGPVEEAEEVVDTVVDTILDLLPSPSPSALLPLEVEVPVVSPTPLLSVDVGLGR